MPIKVQKAYKMSNRLDKIKVPLTLNNPKIKSIEERISKAMREKDPITFTGRFIWFTHDFSMETQKARKAWTDVLQM